MGIPAPVHPTQERIDLTVLRQSRGGSKKIFYQGSLQASDLGPFSRGVEGWGGLIIFCVQIHSKNI